MADLPVTDGKDLVTLLDMLKPIPEPAPISMWPATQAWIWLGLALLVLLGWAGWRIHRHWTANAYRRAALVELKAAGDDPVAIAAILRRAALVAYPRRQVAGLVGAEWLSFLDRTGGKGAFSSDLGAVLISAPYRPQPASPALAAVARDWLKSHKVNAPTQDEVPA